MDPLGLQRFLGHEGVETPRGYLEAPTDEDVGERARQTGPAGVWRL